MEANSTAEVISKSPSATELTTARGLCLCSQCVEDVDTRMFKDIIKAAKDGCDQLEIAIRSQFLAQKQILPPTEARMIGSSGDDYLRPASWVGVSPKDPYIQLEFIQLRTEEEDEVSLPAFQQYRRLPEAQIGEDTFRIIQQWLDACLTGVVLPGTKGRMQSGHSQCDKNDFKPLPKRILSLESGKLRLMESEQGEYGKYTCLSYCWGDTKFLQTTNSSLAQHTREIWLSDMPVLFQEAVQVCHALSIPYLWIDALCIIQDCTKDWAEQAARMADIYSCAYLTIAATSAPHPQTSLFARVPPPEVHSAQHSGQRGFKIAARFPLRHPWRDRRRGSSLYPLQRRGWVLQEECLPPRTLHFLFQEVAFVCCAGSICECSMDDTRRDEWEDVSARLGAINPKLFPTNRSPNDRTFTDTIRSWHRIVQVYTSTHLSRKSDRLPAISGLAKSMARHDTNDKYLSGLWKNSLIFDLLWGACWDPHGRKSSNAPSWSWASVEGGVFFQGAADYDSMQLSAGVDEKACNVRCEHEDEYGQVSGGSLVLIGKMVRGPLQRYHTVISPRLDSKGCGDEPDRSSAWVKYDGKSIEFTMDYDLYERGFVEGTELALFLLCVGDLDEHGCGVTYAMVLYQNPERGQYWERVGLRKLWPNFRLNVWEDIDPQRVEIR